MTQYATLNGGLFDGTRNGLKLNQGYTNQNGVGGQPGTTAGVDLVFLGTDKLVGTGFPITLQLNDNAQIKSPTTSGNHVLVCRLDSQTIYSLLPPPTNANHILNLRMRKDLASGGQVDALVEMRQDYVSESNLGVLICQIAQANITPAFTDYTHTLSAGEVALITNYANLYLRIVGTSL